MQDNTTGVRTCEFCHGPNYRRNLRARFCSPDCKARSDQAKASEIRRQARVGRVCEQCSGLIPLNRNGRARFCSHNCKQAWQNETRQAAKRAAWLATNPKCKRCGDLIPETRFRNSKYCSPSCKKKDADARWRASAPGYNRLYHYGITPEQYDAMLAVQNGVCAICGTSDWMGKDPQPHVDHCHATKIFRGLLCMDCNMGLGKFGDDPDRLRTAAEYLERALLMASRA